MFLSTIIKYFPLHLCHWEHRKKTALACIRYCSKADTQLEPHVTYGKPSIPMAGNELGEAQQSSLIDFCNDIRDNKISAYFVAKSDPELFVRHYRGLERLENVTKTQKHMKRSVIVYYGKPGSGKTRTAYSTALRQYRPDEIYKYDKVASGTTEWWDGYIGQPCVIIDEMVGSKFVLDRFLSLLDRYPCSIQYKGGSTHLAAELIFITSNRPPSEWYGGKNWNALRRRIDECRRFVLVRRNGKPKQDADGLPVFKSVKDLGEMCPSTNKSLVAFQDTAHADPEWCVDDSDEEDPILCLGDDTLEIIPPDSFDISAFVDAL